MRLDRSEDGRHNEATRFALSANTGRRRQELRLRHTNSSIMAQGCDLEVPLVGERPPGLPPGGPVRGAALGDS